MRESFIKLNIFKLLLLPIGFVCIVFFVFRLTALKSSPPGFFVDEASIGLNAYTLLKNGTDEYGTKYPLYFKAFGDYKNPLFVYSVVPVLALWGVSITSVRLTAALWGLAAVGVGSVLFWRTTKTKSLVWIGALIVLTCPWLVQLARVAFEIAAFPFFFFLAALMLVQVTRAKIGRVWIWWLCFALSLDGLFYAYTSGRLLAPLLLVLGFLSFWGKIKWRTLLLASMVFGVGLMPSLLWEQRDPGALLARYSVVGLSGYTHTATEFFSRFVTNYFSHFTYEFLFAGGDTYLRHSATSHSLFFLALLPLFILGVLVGCVKKRDRLALWALGVFLLSPVPAALTIQAPHALRAVGMVGSALILVWFGTNYLAQSRMLEKMVLGLLVLTLCYEALLFRSAYLTDYTLAARAWFDAGTVEVLAATARLPGIIWISKNLYPGTYATADFLVAAQDVNTYADHFTRVRLFDEKNYWPQNGMLIMPLEACDALQKNYIISMRSDAACMVHYK